MFRLLRFLAVLAVASIGLTGVVVAAVPQVSRIVRAHKEVALPVPDIVAQPRRSIVYDSTGLNVTDVFKVENREPFSLDRVPEPVIAAVLAVEDADFWKHNGVNGSSIMRAFLANVGSGSVSQGGSTITQQVVKNLIMNPSAERTVKTKVIEATLARRLEKKMGKKYVLEQYLNAVYFGNNAYGLQSAAEVYFGKSIEQLTMLEGAFLGGMIRNPTDYDPFVRPERARFRFRQALDRLVAVHRLTPAEAEADNAQFVLPTAPQRPPQLAAARSYFTEAVKDYLLNDSTILGATYQERYNKLFRGGLRIYTTEDLYLEAFARDAHDQILPANAARLRRRAGQPEHQDRRHRGDARRSGLRPEPGQPHPAGPPDRVGVQVRHPDGGPRHGRAAQRPHQRPGAVRAPQPGRPEAPLRDRQQRREGGQPRRRPADGADLVVDQLRLRPPGPGRGPQPGGRLRPQARHQGPAEQLPLARHRQQRDLARSTWRRPSRRWPTRAPTWSPTTSRRSWPRTARSSTSTRPSRCRSSARTWPTARSAS